MITLKAPLRVLNDHFEKNLRIQFKFNQIDVMLIAYSDWNIGTI